MVMSHMVQFKDLINVGILNAEWVGFQGDSEYVDENGEVQLGYWSFVEVLDESADYPWTVNDKIPVKELNNWLFKIKNSKNHTCVVKFNY